MPDDEHQSFAPTSNEMHHIYLALGSNQGDRRKNLLTALQYLHASISFQSISSLYETQPVGYLDQPLFYNIACAGTTTLSAYQLLHTAKKIERDLGRQPTFRNGPRPIDIDILLFDNLIMEQEQLYIPHPRMRERAFVLAPLVEIAPNLIEPITGKSIYELAQKCSFEGVTKVATHWSDSIYHQRERRTHQES